MSAHVLLNLLNEIEKRDTKTTLRHDTCNLFWPSLYNVIKSTITSGLSFLIDCVISFPDAMSCNKS